MKKYVSLLVVFALLLSMLVPVGVTAATPSVTLPTGLTSDGSYTSSDNSTVYYYTGVKKSDYDTYVSTLTGEGYTSVQSYQADSCYYSLMDNGTATVYVSFLRSVSGTSKGRLRVFVGDSGTPYHTQSTAVDSNICDSALWQLDVDNSGGDDGGMSYVIRLTDGKFVVIDGGYRTASEADNLYSVLYANNALEGKPVIAAWFISHLHIDHYGVLSAFADKYMDNVTVEAFYYNFPGQQLGDIGPANATSVENTMKRFSGAVRYSKIHSGMVMGFAGATAEVLATHEDVRQSYYKNNYITYTLTANDFAKKSDGTTVNGNDTSTVIRFNIAGQSILFLADACEGVSNAITGTYTTDYIKSDIVQVAHHGFDDGATDALYKAAMESGKGVLLWPMDIIRYKSGALTVGTTTDTKTFLNYYDNNHGQSTAYGRAKDVFPAYQNQMLSFPYEAVGNKPTDAEAHFTALAESKVAVKNAANDIRIQMSKDGSAIRFIGILNVTEEQLKNSFDSFGFELAFKYNGKTYTRTISTKTVYESIIAGDETVTAAKLNGKYLYGVEITELDGISEDVEFVITGIGSYGGNTYSYGIWRYTVGAVGDGMSTGSNGSVTGFDFADIISGAWTIA